jgi:hypothetical protein
MTLVALAAVLISLAFVVFAVVDTLRFVRRTGGQMPVALTYRAYLA